MPYFQELSILSNFKQYPPLKKMFRNVFEQKEVLKVFLPIEKSRKQLKDNIPPREAARTQAVTAPNTSA